MVVLFQKWLKTVPKQLEACGFSDKGEDGRIPILKQWKVKTVLKIQRSNEEM